MDLKDKLLDYAKTKYIVAMIIVFLMGIAINQISTRMAEGSWDNAINEIKDKDLAKIVDQYHSARENVVWWSISSEFGAFIAASVIVHLLYFFLIKREEMQRISNVITEVTEDTRDTFVHGASKWGLIRFHDKIDLVRIINSLEAGDELCWLDAYCPHIESASNIIKNATKRGAKIKILIMDPGNEAVHWRSKEIDDFFYSIEENYRNRIQHFIEFIKSLSISESDSISYRKYLDSPGSPIYVITKKDNTITAYSSYYLNKLSPEFFFMEWSSVGAENGGLASVFRNQFQKKWAISGQYDLPLVEGEWQYQMIAKDIPPWKAIGSCSIKQTGRKLEIDGERIETNDERTSSGIKWRSSWAEVCKVDSKIRFDYRIFSTDSDAEHPAFCRLEIKENDFKMPNRMEGDYFLLEKKKNKDKSAASDYGTIIFERKNVSNLST